MNREFQPGESQPAESRSKRSWMKFVARDRTLLLAVMLLMVAVGQLIVRRVNEPRAGGLTSIAERRALSHFGVVDTNGKAWDLTSKRGNVVLVNLWATWCGPCLEETPALVQVARDLGPRGLTVLGVSLDAGGATPANAAKVESFALHYHVDYPLAFPPPGSMTEFAVENIPTTILVDREGRVAKTYIGPVRAKVFAADAAALLRED